MSLYSSDSAMICKVFTTSLGSLGLLWLDSLKARSGCDHKLAVTSFKLDLDPEGRVFADLVVYAPDTMEWLMERIEKYYLLEDARAERKAVEQYLITKEAPSVSTKKHVNQIKRGPPKNKPP
ncbi:hypothetical protein Vadar_004653 [Vaccinium darrowii]|uniref:Uncharacterized protein n=1 Tax=Vaccinium darrowii TaxID=229202 RepID=A0ACB7YBV9_9ERIC|nr:hypothetical protein Vadar_004653 [Vaccinium darrowii]